MAAVAVVIGKKKYVEECQTDTEDVPLSESVVKFHRDKDQARTNEQAVPASQKLEMWIKDIQPGQPSKRDWVLGELKERCSADRVRNRNYIDLFSFLFFTVLYISMLFWQRRVLDSFFVSEIFADYTPQQDNGEPNQPFGSWYDMVDWMEETFVDAIWVDPSCGDSICQSGFEDPGWGHPEFMHGCLTDCGALENVTEVVLVLDHTQLLEEGLLKDNMMKESAEAYTVNYNLCTVNPRTRVCWFEQMQPILLGEVVNLTMMLPDEAWFLDVEGDLGSKYLRGSIMANSLDGMGCRVDCSLERETDLYGCFFECDQGKEEEDIGEHYLVAFEICEYHPGDNGTLTYQDYAKSTPSPTTSPTYTTLSPSTMPTGIPTTVPTGSPTSTPTASPTWPATDSPTASPSTLAPTAPTAAPTGQVVDNGDPDYSTGSSDDQAQGDDPGSDAPGPGMGARRRRVLQLPMQNDPMNPGPGMQYPEDSSDSNLGMEHPPAPRAPPPSPPPFCTVGFADCKNIKRRALQQNEDACDGRSLLEANVAYGDNQYCRLPAEYVGKTYAQACANLCCATPQECAALGKVMLVGGEYPWEGIVQMTWRDDPMAVITPEEDSDDTGVVERNFTVCPTSIYGPNEAMVICRSMGYEGVLDFYLEQPGTYDEQTESKLLSMQWDEQQIRAVKPKFVPKLSTPATISFHQAACAGDEPSPFQCDIENSFDDQSGCEGVAVNVACWPGVSAYNQAICGSEECCAPGCLPKVTNMTDWNQVSCQMYGGSGCPVAIQGLGTCDAACNNLECARDDWQCCSDGFVIDTHSGTNDCCEPTGVEEMQYKFTLNGFGGPREKPLAQDRYIGMNRVVSGMFMFQTRRNKVESSNRFDDLYQFVYKGLSRRAYGLNPFFLPQSELYVDDLNASFLYPNLPDAENAEPTEYTAFDLVDLTNEGFGKCFPVVMSIANTNEMAKLVMTYMKDGHYFDSNTESFTLQIVMYNGQVDLFSNVIFDMQLTGAGSIVWKYSLNPIDVNLYDTSLDKARMVVEIIYVIMVIISAISEIKEALGVYRETGSIAQHFASMWNYLDALSISFNIISILIWCYMAYFAGNVFKIQLVEEYYQSKYWGRLTFDLAKVKRLARSFSQLNFIAQLQSVYVSICGANMFFFLLRIFKLLDFQPQMGILTRTIASAMDDLMHFFVLLALVLMVYVFMGNIIFGPTMKVFSTPQASVRTTLDMLFGEFGDTEAELFSVDIERGWLNVPAVLFFYSFMMIVFLVILNFLLAIVVDAFTDVKADVGEHDASMFAEVAQMMRNKFLSISSSDYRKKQSLSAIEEKVNQLKPFDQDVDDEKEKRVFSKLVPTVQMQDERYKVLMNEKLLGQVLSSTKDSHHFAHETKELAGAVIKTFGTNMERELLEDPVIVKETDKTALKLSELEQKLDLTGTALKENAARLTHVMYQLQLLVDNFVKNPNGFDANLQRCTQSQGAGAMVAKSGYSSDGAKSDGNNRQAVLARDNLDTVMSSQSQNKHRGGEQMNAQQTHMKIPGVQEGNDGHHSSMLSQDNAAPSLFISEHSVESQL